MSESISVLLGAEVQSVHLPVISPLVESGRGLVVLEAFQDGTVDDNLETERKKDVKLDSCRSVDEHLVVLELAADNPERIVDGVVVNVHFGHALRRPAWNPAPVAIIVDHHSRPGCDDGMLTVNGEKISR